MTLKPVQPLVYDGSADLKAFHRFMMESTTYVKDRNVPEKKQVFMIAHFLTGKGCTFYAEEVAADPYSWRLQEFSDDCLTSVSLLIIAIYSVIKLPPLCRINSLSGSTCMS